MPLEPRPPTPAEQIASRRRHDAEDRLAEISRKVDAGEPVDIEPGGYQKLTETELRSLSHDELAARWKSAWEAEPDQLRTIGPEPTFAISGGCGGRDIEPLAITGHNGTASTKPDPELDEWRRRYGRLDRVNDYPLRIIDWRPIAAGIALVALAAIARWTVRHGR